MDQYPNLIILPVIYIVNEPMTKIIPFVFINLTIESIYLHKNEGIGFLGETTVKLCEIVTPTASDPYP